MRLAATFLLVISMRPAYAQSVTAEVEPNNSAATATSLDLSVGYAIASGSISAAGDADYFSFTAPAGAQAWLLVDTGGAQAGGSNSRDSRIELLDSNGSSVIESDDDDGSGNGGDGTEESDRASAIGGHILSVGGTFYVRVTEFAGEGIINPYRLHVVLTTAAPAVESENNGTPALANVILTSGAFSGLRTGAINEAGDVDVYAVTVAATNTLFVNADCDRERDGTGTDVAIELLAPDRSTVLYSANSSASEGAAAEAFSYALPAAGTYYVRVRHASNGTGGYLLMVASGGGGVLQFGAPTYTSPENGSAVVTIVRSGGSAGSVTVQFSSANGTALAPGDYTNASRTLTFAAGVTTQTVAIAIVNDTQPEPNETVSFTLRSPTGGAALGSVSNAVLVILDNDEVPDNTRTTARTLDLGSGLVIVSNAPGSLPLLISPEGDEDWYAFTAPVGWQVWTFVDTGGTQLAGGTSRDSRLTLFAGDGTTAIEEDDDDGSGNGGDSTLEPDGDLASAIAGRTLFAGGTHYLRVRSYLPELLICPYHLYVAVTGTLQIEEEPNDTVATATPIVTAVAAMGVRQGNLNPAGESDFYSVFAPAGSILFVSVDCDSRRNGSTVDAVVELVAPDGLTLLFTADSAGSEINAAEAFCYKVVQQGTYFIRVRPYSAQGTGPYRLMVAREQAVLKISGLNPAGADMRVSFTATPGLNYRVDGSENLARPTNWMTLPGTVTATGGVAHYLDVGGANKVRRFYRVWQAP